MQMLFREFPYVPSGCAWAFGNRFRTLPVIEQSVKAVELRLKSMNAAGAEVVSSKIPYRNW
jgi:hypothetical protein